MASGLNVFLGHRVPAEVMDQLMSIALQRYGVVNKERMLEAVLPHLIPESPWRPAAQNDAALAAVESVLFRAYQAGEVVKVFDPRGRFCCWKRPRPKGAKTC